MLKQARRKKRAGTDKPFGQIASKAVSVDDYLSSGERVPCKNSDNKSEQFPVCDYEGVQVP